MIARILIIASLLTATVDARQGTPLPSEAPQAPSRHRPHAQAKPGAKPGAKPAAPAKPAGQEHQGHEGHTMPTQPPAGVPPLTDDDRRAAFPDLDGQHTVHDRAIHSFLLFDQLEWQGGSGGNAFNVEANGWIGGDINRFWFRTEGESEGGDVHEAEAHALYGRAIARWWDLVAGVRQDFEPGPAQTWAAVGIQGLAPYWFEVEATGYVGKSGRTHARLEVEYEVLLTNRLVAQPLVEVNLYGKAIPESGIGAGLSSTDIGVRLRYEIRRELAPYVGLTWQRRYGETADFARADGEDVSGARAAVGLRLWF